METEVNLDRLAPRAKPQGEAIMQQTWENLLFLHWPIDPALLRPLIPQPLQIDTFEDQAWIGVTPFALTNLHLTNLPPVPGLSAFNELNFRTYVHHNELPGVWFFSLDASKLIPALAARLFFMLPYFKAEIAFGQRDGKYQFALQRAGPPAAGFDASWRVGLRLRDPDVDSLAFFLVERYCYFAVAREGVYTTRIYHHPWILEEAFIESYASKMLCPIGLPDPTVAPLAHFSRSLNVDIWQPAIAGP
jgi:uncharacterized protein YqjF (DUF2071 family)